ncbi:MAG TPA: EAL domain-containing protein [Candidatus Polarisedimenticolia bacterium]|nr:EAL domain-containing protein [Candidatus Polarisedimenticolia bacterium]
MHQRRRKTVDAPTTRGRARVSGAAAALTELLYDEVTDLPTVPLLLGHIRRMLRESRQLGLLSISILQSDRAAQSLGWEAYESLVRDVAGFLLEIKRIALRREDYLSEVMISGNAFVILLSPPRGRHQMSYPDLDKVRRRIGSRLGRFVRDRLPPEAQERFGLFLGCAVLTQDASPRFERGVYAALEEAFRDSLQQRRRQKRRDELRLKEVIRAGAVRIVYQPVVDLSERRVIGFEALTRITNRAFEGPDRLFKAAHEHDALWTLERLCRNRAIRGARGLRPDQLLFLNMEPDSIHDPALRSTATFDLIREAGLKPTQIVLEMTEHQAVRDPVLFRQLLNHLQFQGFRLAVDDVGSGYSGLRSIADLKPDFIKIDMALIRGIHRDPIKQDLTGTIARFSAGSGLTLIAEGVETREELRCLRSIGVRYMQGFLFARPAPPFPTVDLAAIGEDEPRK